MNEMIDLHNHILYGLDDGPETLTESLEMCRIGYEDGMRTIVATPHTLNSVYQTSRSTVLSKVAELNTALCENFPFPISDFPLRPLPPEGRTLPLTILPGSDVHLCEETLLQFDQGTVTTIGDGKKFILIEFPPQGIPSMSEEALLQFVRRGVIPIISHPERNMEIGRRIERYSEMIRLGCLGQVTAMSLTGEFGRRIMRFAQKLLAHRLVHFIASDAHSANGRPPILSLAVEAAAKIVGEEEARRMVTVYPRAVLDGQKPSCMPPIPF